MAELEIDQSNLPRVQEVCQTFAVLEDGVLAHNLQEQEIEQYYTTNIQKNQLVQNDIRIARRLQHEEEQQRRAQQSALKQVSRQIEERDFEYARAIQEDLRRCAEEAKRREQDDEEIAKRLQEEEEQEIRRRSQSQEDFHEGSTSDPALPSSHQHTFSRPLQGEEQYLSVTTRWQHSTSHRGSVLTGTQTSSPRGAVSQSNTNSWSNQGQVDTRGAELRETINEDSDDLDAVFTEQLSLWARRLYHRNTAPPQKQASSRPPQERNYRSLSTRSSFTQNLKSWEEETGNCAEDCYENEWRVPRNVDTERKNRNTYEDEHEELDRRSAKVSERRCRRSESVRIHDQRGHRNRDLARTWSYKENPDKRVHFQDDQRRSIRQNNESRKVWEMLGQILQERGVPVKVSDSGAPLQIRPQSRDSQVLHGSEVSYGDSQPHQRAFYRAATTRHSFHGDIRQRRRLSNGENIGRVYREDQDMHHYNGAVSEIHRERDSNTRRKEHKYANTDNDRERNANQPRIRRTTSERRHWHKIPEQTLSSEEEQEVERRAERPRRRALHRSQSFSTSRGSTTHRSKHIAAGASLQPGPREAGLDLGELHQVLQDEELARKLQEEEEKELRRTSLRNSYPEGDFRVAQVAQDEEIAHFMQKEEMKAERRSRELEGPGSWHEHRAMISHYERRAARERPVQRERLDSEGLPSPTEECSPENQPPSPIHAIPKSQQMRNIAEELDPTFPTHSHVPESFRAGQTGQTSGPLPVAPSGSQDILEEPTFIPPTKRQTDKSGRNKAKEKREGCKQQ
ncbi:coiled-coil domain-containing protein 187 isoform X1 [Cyprinodon tularosa]|uniref:coiled-coil domain-containing protein 187 isoform X1 n=1 Tax=Cyprinodon tularosa TaxID=77115 RepID=UPI0018E27622|nr:coiled-coil domain-containing protein 187 isoform X1 [Cyprinodon tularosa]